MSSRPISWRRRSRQSKIRKSKRVARGPFGDRRSKNQPLAVMEPLEPRLLLNADHSAALDLVPTAEATHVAVASGNWFDASTWQGGEVPGDTSADEGAKVHIPDGLTVDYNGISSVELATLRVDGTLSFVRSDDTRLTVDTIVVTGTGWFDAGTSSSPIPATATSEIIFPDRGPIDFNWDPNALSRGLLVIGEADIHGADKTDWLAVDPNDTVSAGESTITLESAPSGWEVGDEIVLTGTETDMGANGHGDENFQDEVRTITAINGATITLDAALSYDHHVPAGFGLSPYVANTTRNVSFATEDWETDSAPTQQRGHVMFMTSGADVNNAGFYGLGRTDKTALVSDPDGSGGGLSNPRGRYSLHVHKAGADVGDGYATIRGNAVVDSPGWGYTAHGSKAIIEDNVSFDVVGAHYVTEDGDELVQFRRNIAIGSAGSDTVANLLAGGDAKADAEDFGARGMGFWIDTPFTAEAFEDNVTASTFGPAIIVYGQNDFHDQPDVPSGLLPASLDHIDGGASTINSWEVPLRDFRNNESFNTQGGLEIRGHLRDDSGFYSFQNIHSEHGVVENMTVWGVREFGIHSTYASYLHYKDALVIGDPADPITRDGAAPTSARGGGLFMQKNTRGMIIENPTIRGFENGLVVSQTDGQGYGEAQERQAAQPMRLIGGHFEDNLYNLEPSDGRENNAPSDTLLTDPPFNLWFELTGNPNFVVSNPAGNQLPTASFSSSAAGGLAVSFDASGSDDPDHPLDSIITDQNTNTIAAHVWDFGDGTTGFGRYADYTYSSTGSYDVTLTVYDQQGQTDTFTQTVNVQNTVQPNIVIDGDFSSPGSEFNNGGANTHLSRVDYGWYRPNGHKWNKDAANGWAEADTDGAGGLIQVIHDHAVTRGIRSVNLDAINTGGDELRLKVWGVEGVFSTSNWGTDGPENISNSEPFSSTLIYDGDFSQTMSSWQTDLGSDNVDFGSGYEFIVVELWTGGSSANQAVDNIFIGGGSGSTNSAPTIGTDLAADETSVTDGDTVLTATGNDADGDTLTYTWSVVSQPGGSNVSFSDGGSQTQPAGTQAATTASFDTDGDYTFEATVSDGTASVITQQVTVTVSGSSSSGGENIVVDGDFSASGDFLTNSSRIYQTDADEGWHVPGNHKWYKDATNLRAIVDDGGAAGLAQVVLDNSGTTGLQEISFDAINDEVAGSANELKLYVWGVDGDFVLNQWEETGPMNSSETATVGTLLHTQSIGGSSFGDPATNTYQSFSTTNVDFGGGYQYIVVMFWTGNVDTAGGDFQAVDNLAIAGDGSTPSNSAPTIDTDLAADETSVTDGDTVLTATGNDADGDTLTYTWSVVSQPGGSNVSFSDGGSQTQPAGTQASTTASFDTDGDYTFEATISDGTDTVTTQQVSVTVDMFDDVTIAATDPDAAEAGQDPGQFTISRTGTTGSLDVSYSVSGTASSSDYTESLSGTATIPDGQSSVTIDITPVDDSSSESEETVVLTIADGAAYDLGATVEATVTIADNDSASLQEITIDNVDSEVTIVGGSWSVTSGTYIGSDFHTTGTGAGKYARYTPDLTGAAGEYEVFAFYTDNWWNLSTAGEYIISHDGGQATVTIDQTSGGGTWVSLGTFNLSDGAYVDISADLPNGRPVYDGIRFTPVQPLTASGEGPAQPVATTIDAGALDRFVEEAMRRWHRAGEDVGSLSGLEWRVADLPGDRLGQTVGRAITLDRDAAELGWFVDPTPATDHEFGRGRTPAGVDLLTVVAHELGHALGLGHEADPQSVMHEELDAGVRLTPSASDRLEAWLARRDRASAAAHAPTLDLLNDRSRLWLDGDAEDAEDLAAVDLLADLHA